MCPATLPADRPASTLRPHVAPDLPHRANFGATIVALSAGLLVYRLPPTGGVEVLVVHPGGPFWARKDEGAWSIPKGEYQPGEEPLGAARREFSEELGSPPPDGPAIELGEIRQSSGKRVVAWAVLGDLDVARVVSNEFEMEWPRGSGRAQAFPEVDRAEWFAIDVARTKLVRGQVDLLDRLLARLADQ